MKRKKLGLKIGIWHNKKLSNHHVNEVPPPYSDHVWRLSSVCMIHIHTNHLGTQGLIGPCYSSPWPQWSLDRPKRDQDSELLPPCLVKVSWGHLTTKTKTTLLPSLIVNVLLATWLAYKWSSISSIVHSSLTKPTCGSLYQKTRSPGVTIINNERVISDATTWRVIIDRHYCTRPVNKTSLGRPSNHCEPSVVDTIFFLPWPQKLLIYHGDSYVPINTIHSYNLFWKVNTSQKLNVTSICLWHNYYCFPTFKPQL